jgi:hypothetical protein
MAFGNRVTRWMYDHSPPPVQELVAGIYSRGRSQMKYGAKFYEYLTDLERTQWYKDKEHNYVSWSCRPGHLELRG